MTAAMPLTLTLIVEGGVLTQTANPR